jgi:twitching motility protein PilT
VVSRLKIMSELDIAEKRVPQDGRVSLNVEDRRVDLRITTLPTQNGEGAAIRILDKSNASYSLDDIGLEGEARKRFEDSFRQAYGAVLVTGPTGSGKSTTLASMIDRINTKTRGHIITIEDPIEFQHQHKNCLINQREIGRDSQSFKRALKYILRQDPDVVLIGEMRDLETIEAALTIAETGHLALGTLHTNNAIQSINRIVDVFPAHAQSQVRSVLSFVLEGVVTQVLIPRASGTGRQLAAEVMVPNAAIRNLIREDKLHQIYSQMQIGQAKFGMQTMNQALVDLYLKKLISLEDCLGHAGELDELKTMILNAGGSLGNTAPPSHVRR